MVLLPTQPMGKDGYVKCCEITMIVLNALYLMGILLIKYGKEVNIWLIVGTIKLSAFVLGCLDRCEDIILLGIITIPNRWDKMKNKIKQCVKCCKRVTNFNSADPLCLNYRLIFKD